MVDLTANKEWDASEIAPKPEMFSELIARHTGPVVVLNLLKFKPDAVDGRTGAEAFAAYGAAASELVRAHGGEVVWSGKPVAALMGNTSDAWDLVSLMRYPSAGALAEMTSSLEYKAAHHDRELGIERTTVIACAELPALEP